MLGALLIFATASSQDSPLNKLTADEMAAGFELLFDGKSLANFKGYNRDDVPTSWSASGGELVFTPGSDRGDLSTVRKFTDFDLRVEFKISAGGNSGIKILVAEDGGEDSPIGPEFQIIDDTAYELAANQMTGANYDMHAPVRDAHRPAGQWNKARILKRGNSVEHWLNGFKIVEYELHSEDWVKRRAASKYSEMPSYAKDDMGYICFQDHGTRVWFRNMRIRRL
ncbi:MAG: DUF1080 domain-containing protein [Armatimonadetes bacterium]|nr:DUF1080 domain-containing protein [Armatimonadota bacterium]